MSIIYERLQSGVADPAADKPDTALPGPAQAGEANEAPPQLDAPRRRPAPADGRSDRDALRQALADKRKLERALDHMRGALDKQTARLKKLEIEARGRKPMAPSKVQALATEVEQWRAKALALQQDIYSSTHLLELAKQEIDKQKKAQQELRAALSGRESEAGRMAALEDECRRLREVADRALNEHARALAELNAEQDAGRAAQQAADETNHRLHAELEQLRRQHETAAAAQRHERQALADRLGALDTAARQPQWYLRLDDGSVMGPTDQDEIYEWACDCRIGPAHMLSRDRLAWMPAREVVALRMEWMVDLVDGSCFGPLNIFAVQHLLGDGSVRPESRLVNTRSGTVCKAADVTAPDILALREEHKRAMQELAALRGALARAQARIVQLEPPTTGAAPPKTVRTLLQKHRTTR
ncbi:MAG: hypothetical protein K8T26_20420 [Lentisphaerae bacterium]|nr:hypothetical protein [Lentisphaerota bacterium]